MGRWPPPSQRDCIVCGKKIPWRSNGHVQRKTCSDECRNKTRTGRKRKPRYCLMCGEPLVKRYSQVCDGICRKSFQALRCGEKVNYCVFTPDTDHDYYDMIATLERKGFHEVKELTQQKEYEYTASQAERRISFHDKPPSRTSVDWQTGTQKELQKHWNDLLQEAREESASAVAVKKLLQRIEGRPATDQRAVGG